MPKVRKLSQDDVQRLELETAPSEPEPMRQTTPHHTTVLEDTYPYVAAWVTGGGWIEIGQDDYSRSFIRVLDIGGMIWEGKARYSSLDAALQDADRALAHLEETGEI